MHTLAAHPHIARHAEHGSSAILKRSRIEPDRDMKALRHLQQSLGNQAMQRLFEGMMGSNLGDAPGDAEADAGSGDDAGPAPVQAKLTINTPGDQYEQEADRVADQVMGAHGTACCKTPPSVKAAAPHHSGPGTDAPGSRRERGRRD